MGRVYDLTLECGCMISEDGGGGCIPCYSEYGDMRNKVDKKQVELCGKCWKVYLKQKPTGEEK